MFSSLHYSATFKIIMLCLTFSFFLNSCSSVSSLVGGRHKYDHAQNFENMQRYNFHPAPEKVKIDNNYNFITHSGVVLSIENRMAAKKIRKERILQPDFWVNYYFTGEQAMTTAQINKLFAYNLGLAWDDKYGGGKGIADNSHSFSRRTLVIDLVSRDNNHLIWRGSAPTGITAGFTEQEKRNSLDDAVKVILSPFPPENDFSSLKSTFFNE